VRTELPQIQNFIDGQFVQPADGKYLDNIEPATGKPYSQVADSDARDVEAAVAAAEKAFVDWSKNSATERSKVLLHIADLIERDLEKLARAESIDTGKPLSLARTLDIPILCDGDPAHGIRSAYHGQCRLQLHAATAARHCGIDFTLEPAALFVELENRASPRGGKYCYCEAERAHANDGLHALRDLPGGRSAERSA
jgi:hypothetical protein